MGPEDSAELAVGGVGQIGVPVGFAAEGDKEAVGKAIRLAFDADIGAPFKGVDGVDLARQGAKSGFDLLGLFRRCAVLEFKEDDVTE